VVLHEGDVSVSRSVIDILLPLNAFLHGTGEDNASAHQQQVCTQARGCVSARMKRCKNSGTLAVPIMALTGAADAYKVASSQ